MLQEIKQGQRHILLNSIGEACGPGSYEIDRAVTKHRHPH